ncbi:preprotein translocase, SecG subunit [Caldicellulosiruptor hydrothermalis 108]|uniref:Protein-export membrane protein SecG n=1 Tax=Caldicellulosiruptor hydrothermalis (strain DSM 18901 / VKM B-2411 / 108) TaxID=632292 RepID=E4QD88_CALH1|nr:preprotein translocase subunit SecG [Caldicellulosiruptor hydrothermalis]ADQ06383.1 preprotein translocase, SecG subunit [Caldicellulosiruptor hydrothermalis 108]
MAKIILTILELLLAIALIIVVLLQSGKSAGLSGSIAGGAETFFGKYKGRTLDAMLGRYTWIIAAAFFVVSVILFFVIK